MASLAHQCPHCLTEKMAHDIVAQTTASAAGRRLSNYVHLQCPGCGKPSAAEVSDGTGGLLGPAGAYPLSIQRAGWAVVTIWPEVPKPRIPDHLPTSVARAYLVAERIFPQLGMEDACAGSYGKALETATKLYAPDLVGLTLFARINKLAETTRITPALADWANAIRVIRNGAMHEIDSVSRDELVAVRGFSEMVLTYLFTLPGMLEARKALTAEKPKR